MNAVSGGALLAGIAITGAGFAGVMAGGLVDQVRYNPSSGLNLLTVPLGLIGASAAVGAGTLAASMGGSPMARVAIGAGMAAALGAAAIGGYRLADPR